MNIWQQSKELFRSQTLINYIFINYLITLNEGKNDLVAQVCLSQQDDINHSIMMVNDSKINIKNSICNISTFLYFLIYGVDQFLKRLNTSFSEAKSVNYNFVNFTISLWQIY